ncbi:aminoglycoside adenylyltransferase domain-containing protein [Fictibacillus sp. NPDC058756]|uniref:aminoglycoside adenylyltransferase domain-containing protein n=1 Tax=Fictibacillus sp. NPDC058756 TaxID=3346625 RepID=UPI0036BA7690
MNQTLRKKEQNRVPVEVKEVVNEYFKIVDERLPNLLESFYLFGSVSLGAYQGGMSDIDFYAVVRRKLTDADVEVLKQVHHDRKKNYPKPSLDGMYVTREDLDGRNEGVQSCPYFNEGKLQMYRAFHRNWIDAYQLKTYGIVIKGLPIETYNITTDWNQLKKNLVGNINSYWMNWTKRCESVTSLQFPGLFVSGSMIEWGVLGVTRLYYSIKEEDIISKVGAGEYALQTVPEKYHQIIQEALRIRNRHKKSCYKSIFKRRRDALNYMKFVMNECNKLNK